MKSDELVGILKDRGMAVLTLADATRITGKSAKYTSLFLSRLANKGAIKRIEKGKYYLNGAGVYAIASNIIYPSYISLLSAFRYHNLTTQIITTVDVISTRRHKKIDNVEEHTINFISTKREKMFGFYRDRDTGAFVAYVEKAIIDSLYLRNPPYHYVEEAFVKATDAGMINFDRLAQFAARMRSHELTKRLKALMMSAEEEHNRIRGA